MRSCNQFAKLFAALLCAALTFHTAEAQVNLKSRMQIGVNETFIRAKPHDADPPMFYLRCGDPVQVLGVTKDNWVKIAILPGQPVKVVRHDGPYVVTFSRPVVGFVKRIMLTEQALCAAQPMLRQTVQSGRLRIETKDRLEIKK